MVFLKIFDVKNIIIFLAFVSICIISCDNKTKLPTEHFKNVTALKGEIIPLKAPIDRAFSISKIGDNLVLMDPFSDLTLKLIDLDTKEIFSFGKKGGGPGELLSPFSFISTNDKELFYVYDVNLRKIFKYNIDSIKLHKASTPAVVKANLQKYNAYFTRVISIDSVHIGIGAFQKGRYALAQNDSIEFFYGYPNDGKEINDQYKFMAYQGNLKRRPNHTEFVLAVSSCGVLEICNFQEGKIQKKKDIHTYYAEYEVITKGKGFGAALDKDLDRGYTDVSVNKDYIFTIFSGRSTKSHEDDHTLCEHLLIYDWEGNPIKYLKLDIPLICITAPNSENEIYGISNNPEPVLIKYTIKL